MFLTGLAVCLVCGALEPTTQSVPPATQPLVAQTLPGKPVPSQPAPAIWKVATGGVPCPKGAYQRTMTLAAVDPAGTQLPTQCDPVAFWPDGSVKWFFVTALVPPKVEQLSIRLAHSPPGTQPATSRPAPLVTQTPSGYLVDTGALRFRVGTDTAGFIADAQLRGDGEPISLLSAPKDRAWQLDYYIADAPGRSATSTLLPPGSLDESNLKIDQVELERAGPVHATIVLRGRYLHGKLGTSFPNRGNVPSRVDIRIHAFAGQSYILLDHTFTYEGNPETDFPAALGLRWALNLQDTRESRITAAGGAARISRWPHRSGGVIQDTYDHYRTYTLAGDSGGSLTVDQGTRCAGWIDLGDQTWGCAVGIVDMAENYPAALEASNEDATVTAWLYPPQVPPADLRGSARQMALNQEQAAPATGLSKTHHLWCYFHRGRDEPARVAAVADNLSEIRLLRPDPRYAASTGVLGPYRPADEKAFPRLETLTRHVTDLLLASQTHHRCFGLFDYGDFQDPCSGSDAEGATSRPDPTDESQRPAWVHDQGLISYWLLWQYLRTGNVDYYKAGCAMTVHARDIDVKHTRAYPWGTDPDQYEYRDVRGMGLQAANPIAWRLHYYLTGDGRSKDCIDEVYQARIVASNAAAGCDTLPAALYSLYARYEMTGDGQYRGKIEAFLAAYCNFASRNGFFPASTPWDFTKGKPSGPFAGNSAESDAWHACGIPNFLIEWYSLTGDEKLRQAMVKQAQATLAVNSPPRAYSHASILAAGCKLGDDPAFAKRIGQLLQAAVANEASAQPESIRTIGGLMSGLPYVEGAVTDEASLLEQAEPTNTVKR